MNIIKINSLKKKLLDVQAKLLKSDKDLVGEKENLARDIEIALEEYKNFVDVFKTIFNSTQEILCINRDGKRIIEANKSFLNFFQLTELGELQTKVDCLCNLFEKVEKDDFIYIGDGFITDENWVTKIANSHKNYKVKVFDTIFQINVNLLDGYNAKNDFVISLSDITISEKHQDILEQKLKEEIEKTNKQNLMLVEQSKLASMGEMLGNIAHQWRQPLNQISLKKEILVNNYYCEQLDDAKIEKFDKKTDELLDYMSKTIDDFRRFFQTDKEKNHFNVVESVEFSLNIVIAQLNYHHIDLKIEKDDRTIVAHGFDNEFKQVLINILNNAKDALLEQKIEKKKIKITISVHENVKIIIQDNAGGIPKNILNKIFEPYFTTKFKSQGTGLGLYMSRSIIHNMHGRLTVKNDKDGAVFMIILPKDESE